MDRIIRMILNRVVGRLINHGINAGVERAARGRGGPAGETTPEQRRQVAETQKRARQAMRTARRFTRF